MALVTVQRSPSVADSPQCSNSDSETEEDDGNKIDKNCSECFFAGKGTALILALKNIPQHVERRLSTDSTKSTNSTQSNNSDIQQHLQSMFNLLRNEETLKMAVKLESQRPNRTRYLVIVSRCCHSLNNDRKNKTTRSNSTKISISGALLAMSSMRQQTVDGASKIQLQINTNLDTNEERSSSKVATNRLSQKSEIDKSSASGDNKFGHSIEEFCLLGIDCNERATIGLVVPILADTTIHLDGDGGFSVAVYGKTHILKPVSVQAMWSALQTLHKVSQKARENNFYPGGPSHDWLAYYESKIESDQSCLNEWNAMDSLESRRPPSPDAIRNKPTEKEETESIIKMKLKEIMMSVDLDEVTSKYIRSRLEEQLDMDLGEYKSFIDEEMLIILGQMDAPTEIFDHVYLGSEWNASNLEELQKNGVRHILNVTREIDNFFPGMFDYFNVRVYDDEKTNLLKHWDNTFRYINRAKDEGSKVLVHCKMGVSRSASVVIAYAMKAYNWEFQQAMQHVKERRSCIKPNKNFLNQLETYRGMLDAMKNKEKLQRSKSETNLKCTKDARQLPGSEPTPLIQALNQSKSKSTGHGVSRDGTVVEVSGGIVSVSSICSASDHRQSRLIRRSSSASPKTIQSHTVIVMKQQSQSLENLTPERLIADEPKNVRFPGSNGENYSVTQNQVLHIQKNTPASKITPNSVKTIVSGLESSQERKTVDDRKILNLQFCRSVSADVNNTKTELCNDKASHLSANDNKKHDSLVWFSSTKLITQTSTIATLSRLGLDNVSQSLRSSMCLRRATPCSGSGDMYSKLDKEFGKEDVRRTRKTQSWAPSSGGIVIDGLSAISHIDKTVAYSRQSSTSSLDSLSTVSHNDRLIGPSRTHQRELPCRHSSWGSGDQRSSLPIRKSSWGACDKNRNSFQLGSNPTTAAAIIEGQIHELNMSNKTSSVTAARTAFLSWKDVSEQQIGTVKRTKQKLEECTVLKKLCQENGDDCTVRASIGSHKRISNLYRSQSAAASTRVRFPNRCNSEEINMSTYGGPYQRNQSCQSDSQKPSKHKYFTASKTKHFTSSAPESYTSSDIENKNTPEQANETIELRHQEMMDEQHIAGNVQILKKSFELKAGAQSASVPVSAPKRGHLSLPSSPVAQHESHMETTPKRLETNTASNYSNSNPNTSTSTYLLIDSSEVSESNEDRNVRGLVHKYQTTRANTMSSSTSLSTSFIGETLYNTAHKDRPRSYYENRHHLNTETHPRLFEKPPHGSHESKPPPSPLRNNFITSSTSMHSQAIKETILTHQQRRVQQHGKTHPLARLSLPKQSFNTAAYNTM